MPEDGYAKPGAGSVAQLFSQQSESYARFRPAYPKELFQFLAGLVRERLLAWDCGAGNGQAALGLAGHFLRVIATDISKEQIASAKRHPRVEYRICPAERATLEPQSADLVVAAQAVHWFDLEGFYREVRRVAKPKGFLAVWCYGLPEVAPEIDAIVRCFYHDLVGPYWPAARKLVEENYATIDFPFAEIKAPPFEMKATWSAADFLGYISTWSAVRNFILRNQSDPVGEIRRAVEARWGSEPPLRVVTWPLHLRVGRLN